MFLRLITLAMLMSAPAHAGGTTEPIDEPGAVVVGPDAAASPAVAMRKRNSEPYVGSTPAPPPSFCRQAFARGLYADCSWLFNQNDSSN